MKEMVYILVAVVIVVLVALFTFRTGGVDQKSSQSESYDSADQLALGGAAENEFPAAEKPSGQTAAQTSSEKQTEKQTIMQKPELTIDQSKKYSAVLDTTEGQISIELFADKTPVTANNFIYLARNNFYDNTIFHRVISGFMIQGGDPKGDGTGGPGYRFDDEPFDGEYTRGAVAMANSGPNTNGSQFFIMHQNTPLPKAYVIFGQVSQGIEVVDKIATAETRTNAMGESSTPVNPVTVNSIRIIEE